LLEIFYSSANNHAFESYANELAKAGKKDDVEFWAKVFEMGSQICHDSTLFSSEVKGCPSNEYSIFEKSTLNFVGSDDVEKNELTDIYENEFIDEQHNYESIDFDSSTIALNTEESSKTHGIIYSKEQDAKVNNEFESFDFDFGSNETEAKGINDSLDRNFYFDKPMSGLNGEEFGQQGGIEVFDLTKTDDLETKLDLVKAYIDMNDMDAAKDTACEVLEKGSAEQKEVAKTLLNNLE
jgi:pilus assembly protein FimV